MIKYHMCCTYTTSVLVHGGSQSFQNPEEKKPPPFYDPASSSCTPFFSELGPFFRAHSAKYFLLPGFFPKTVLVVNGLLSIYCTMLDNLALCDLTLRYKDGCSFERLCPHMWYIYILLLIQ